MVSTADEEVSMNHELPLCTLLTYLILSVHPYSLASKNIGNIEELSIINLVFSFCPMLLFHEPPSVEAFLTTVFKIALNS